MKTRWLGACSVLAMVGCAGAPNDVRQETEVHEDAAPRVNAAPQPSHAFQPDLVAAFTGPTPRPTSGPLHVQSTIDTLWGVFSAMNDAGTTIQTVNAVLDFLGIHLFGTSPTNQDLLNAIQGVSAQIATIQNKIDVLVVDSQQVQIQLSAISGQLIRTNVDAELANVNGAVAGIDDYVYRVSTGQDTGGAATMLSDQTAADVAFFQEDTYYNQLLPTGGYTWTPVYATIPYVYAVGVRLMFLGAVYPNQFLDVPGVRSELSNDADFASSLATKTSNWGHALCTQTITYNGCVSGHYEYLDCDDDTCLKPIRIWVCDVANYGYTDACPGVPSQSNVGYPSSTAAHAAAAQEMPVLMASSDAYLGVNALNDVAAKLRYIVSHP